jgi:hypothetical protein
VAGMGDGQPAWLSALIDGFAHITDHDGMALTIAGVAIMALIGVGIFLPARWTRVIVIAAVVVSAFIWVIGQALGPVFGGESTDVNSGPLLALMALAYWPTRLITTAVETTGANA